ncbi:MAG: flagellar brake protein [Pontibacterium sp.]
MTDAVKKLPAALTLAELKPQVGGRIQLESVSPRLRLSAQLLGYQDGESLMVSPVSPAGNTPVAAEGQALTARLMSGNYVAAFSTRIIKIQDTPFSYWHLEYPQGLEVRRIRKHTRVPISLKVSLDEYEEGSLPMGVWPCSSFCSNLSLSGACIEALSPLGSVGDKLYLTLRVSVANIDQVILAPVMLRNVYQSEGDPASVYSHGVEFLELDEDTRLILASFVYQQFLVETGHIDELE